MPPHFFSLLLPWHNKDIKCIAISLFCLATDACIDLKAKSTAILLAQQINSPMIWKCTEQSGYAHWCTQYVFTNVEPIIPHATTLHLTFSP